MISYIVVQRTREIGIRVDLGARRQDIVGMIATRGIRITVSGLLVGLAFSLVLTRVMESMIYNLNTIDPVTLVAVTLTLGVTGLLACCRPAYRAAVMDPLAALRHE